VLASRGRTKWRQTLGAVLFLVASLCLTSAPARADGFGWYVYFFDYDEFLREYRAGLRDTFKQAERKEMAGGVGRSDFTLLGLLEESDRIALTEPRMHDGELLWANALVEFAHALEGTYPESVGRFFATGRLFIEPGQSVPCKETIWIHGACGAIVMVTPAEAEALFWQVTDLVDRKVKWSEAGMQNELLRLRNVLQEAALLKRAIYFYGHD
jgi:hypothetical protein